jgi:hypothetical protein
VICALGWESNIAVRVVIYIVLGCDALYSYFFRVSCPKGQASLLSGSAFLVCPQGFTPMVLLRMMHFGETNSLVKIFVFIHIKLFMSLKSIKIMELKIQTAYSTF